MFDEVLQKIREKITSLQHVSILNGEIRERQKDRITAESKYRIRGVTIDGVEIEIITKLSLSGKLVIITVYTV